MSKRDDNDNYTTLTLRISRELRTKMAEAARKENKTTTLWLCEMAERKIDGTDEPAKDIQNKIDILSTKLDTLTNMVSKL